MATSTEINANPATERLNGWLEQFSTALDKGDSKAVADLFDAEGFWRDFVTFTWNLKTMEGRDEIIDMLDATLTHVKPGNWQLTGEATEADGITEGWLTFETSVATGEAHIRLNDKGCWTLLTTMKSLKGHEEPSGRNREMGVAHGADSDRKTWLESRADEEASLGYDTQPYCVIIGGGHKSLCLHDPVWYDHLPYLKFPEHWPVFAPKDKLGDWLEMYTKVMELNYWSSTTCDNASYDEASGTWTVNVTRDGKNVTLQPKQLILATGMSAVPNIPDFEGMESFKGDLHHSSKHPGGEAYKGKKCVVIGSNNSSHDICAGLWEAGADVTMVQRSSTHIAKSDTLMDLALGGLYSEDALANGVTTEMADMIFASLPYRVLPSLQVPVYAQMKERDKDLYDRLEKAGFMLDFGEDESGLFCKYLRRGSGYYIDVGASELVANGDIKLKSGVGVERITKTGIEFSDGSSLDADLIVLATGYGSMNGWAAQLISQERWQSTSITTLLTIFKLAVESKDGRYRYACLCAAGVTPYRLIF